jgi:hypothetical protein
MQQDGYAKSLRALIPIEFDLDRYRAANKLDALGWFANLFRRKIARAMVDALPEEEALRSEYLGHLLSILGRDCLFDESFFGLLCQSEMHKMIALGMLWEGQTIEGSTQSLHFRGFRSLTLGDIMEIRGDLRKRPDIDELVSRHESMWDFEKYDRGSREWALLSELFVTPFDMFKGTFTKKKVVRAYASIDLGMPDKLLIESFELWLKCARTMFDIDKQTIKKFSEAQHFRNWASQQVLPYLDLDLWHRFNRKKATNRQMQDILFPVHPKTDRAFYKGTIEIIKMLLERDGLDVLRMQADAEHSFDVQEIVKREYGLPCHEGP